VQDAKSGIINETKSNIKKRTRKKGRIQMGGTQLAHKKTEV
jgi:hypothetical protein